MVARGYCILHLGLQRPLYPDQSPSFSKTTRGKPLDDIENSRLLSFIERTMPWKFDIKYVPGHSIPGPDATSRRPGDTKVTYDDEEECDLYTGN